MAVKAAELVKAYHGRKVVDEVNLEVNQGEVVGLLGPNGAGKTTTFYMIVGLERPDAGHLFERRRYYFIPYASPSTKGFGYLPQEASVFRKLSVEENIRAVLQLMDLTPAERNARLSSCSMNLSWSGFGIAKPSCYLVENAGVPRSPGLWLPTLLFCSWMNPSPG
jgi:lipopolysaccharide export system ATP-binding protein